MRRTSIHLTRLGWVAVFGWIALILVLTLTPGPSRDILRGSRVCLICGDEGVADLLRNVILFIPLGVGLGALLPRRAVRWMLPPLLAALIEGAQLLIPGRNSVLADVGANSVGGWLGILMGAALLELLSPSRIPLHGGASGTAPSSPTGPPLRWFAMVALLLSMGAIIVSSAAFTSDSRSGPLHLLGTARLGGFERYGGEMAGVELGAVQLEKGYHQDGSALLNRLVSGEKLEVRLIAGEPPARVAPLLLLVSERGRVRFLLGAREEDVVVRLPLRASGMALDRPDMVFPSALAGLQPGETFSLGLVVGREEVCVGMRAAEGVVQSGCRAHPSLGDGWGLVYSPPNFPEEGRGILDFGWVLGLAWIPGMFLRTMGGAIGAGALLAAVALAAPQAMGSSMTTSAAEVAILVAGTIVAQAAARLIRVRLTRRTLRLQPPQGGLTRIGQRREASV